MEQIKQRQLDSFYEIVRWGLSHISCLTAVQEDELLAKKAPSKPLLDLLRSPSPTVDDKCGCGRIGRT